MDFVKFDGDGNAAAPVAIINQQAVIAKIPSCALAAIGMRETRFRNIFQIGVPRAYGCGVGDCQITAGVDWSNPAKPTYNGVDLFDRASNYHLAASSWLAPAIADCLLLRERHGDTMAEFSGEILYFAFAAYNEGFGAVETAIINGRDPNVGTTDDYVTNANGTGALDYYFAFVAAAHKNAAAAAAAAVKKK